MYVRPACEQKKGTFMTEAVAKANYKWRVVDIVVAAIIAVASGVIFWGWDIVCSAPLALFEGVTPGFEGLLNGFWLFAGPLAAIIVRKPGAALFAETLAAFLELTLGNQWGVGGSLIVGIIQGLGAELPSPSSLGRSGTSAPPSCPVRSPAWAAGPTTGPPTRAGTACASLGIWWAPSSPAS